jgi:hypothetical protein
MAQNFEKRVLQKCLRITFCTYKPVNPFHFHKKHQNRCTQVPSYAKKVINQYNYVFNRKLPSDKTKLWNVSND